MSYDSTQPEHNHRGRCGDSLPTAPVERDNEREEDAGGLQGMASQPPADMDGCNRQPQVSQLYQII